MNVAFFPHPLLGLAGMPRRYLDYPYCYRGLHSLSRWGAYGGYLSTWWFIFIFWEAVVSKRCLVFVNASGTFLEFNRCEVWDWGGVAKMFAYPYRRNLGVRDSNGLNIGVVGYFRKLKLKGGLDKIVNSGGLYRDKEFAPRGQGYEIFGFNNYQ